MERSDSVATTIGKLADENYAAPHWLGAFSDKIECNNCFEYNI